MNNVIMLMQKNHFTTHLIENVVMGKKYYIDKIQEDGILEKLYMENDNVEMIIDLFSSIAKQIDAYNVRFIEKYIFTDKGVDNRWLSCFNWDFSKDSDELFELRMRMYSIYPETMNNYLNLEHLINECALRTIRVLSLKIKLKGQNKIRFQYEDECVIDESNLVYNDYNFIIEEFLDLLPDKNEDLIFSDWTSRYNDDTIERTCVKLLKKANSIFAFAEPMKFLERYESFKNTGNDLYNEIYLDALYYLPKEYADNIIDYLCSNFNETMFEGTSGTKNKLSLAKRLLAKLSIDCGDESYLILENKIINFTPADAKSYLEHRIKFNNEKNGNRVYWSFWGDFQYECLSVLEKQRRTIQANNLLRVLSDKMRYGNSKYQYDNDSGFKDVVSPILNKNLLPSIWMKIITNEKIPIRAKSLVETDNSYIESNKESFARDFQNEVSKNPTDFIHCIFNLNQNIDKVYINSLYNGIKYSDFIDDISNQELDLLFKRFPCIYTKEQTLSMCRIIEKNQI